MNPNTAGSSSDSENTNAPDEVDGIIASCLGEKNRGRLIHNNIPVLSKSGIYDEFYNMDCKYNGFLLILAHARFNVGGAEPRPKSEEDVKMLVEAFHRLNFHITVKRNLTLRQIRTIIKEVSSMDFDEYASLAIAVSSHGSYDGNIVALDAVYDLKEELIDPFKETESLFGKPKLFFVGCCRGDSVDDGVSMLSSVETDGNLLQEFKIPKEADILIAYATIEGYIAYHNDCHGSQFFIYLTEALNDFANTRDLVTVITIANQRLAISFSSNSADVKTHNKKQCMTLFSTLTRRIRFKVKDPNDIDQFEAPIEIEV